MSLSSGDPVVAVRKKVRAVDRALEILTCFSESHPRLTLAELSEAAGLPKSSTYRIALSLVDYGLLRRDNHGAYALGGRMLELGAIASKTSPISAITTSIVSRLAERTGETVLVAEINWHDRTLVITDRRDTEHALTVLSPVGRRSMIANGCIGKAVLAGLHQHEVIELLPELHLSRRTPRSIVDPDAFLKEIAHCRQRGFATESGEFNIGVAGVSIALIREGRPVGAVAVVAPSARCGARQLTAIGQLMREIVSHA